MSMSSKPAILTPVKLDFSWGQKFDSILTQLQLTDYFSLFYIKDYIKAVGDTEIHLELSFYQTEENGPSIGYWVPVIDVKAEQMIEKFCIILNYLNILDSLSIILLGSCTEAKQSKEDSMLQPLLLNMWSALFIFKMQQHTRVFALKTWYECNTPCST